MTRKLIKKGACFLTAIGKVLYLKWELGTSHDPNLIFF